MGRTSFLLILLCIFWLSSKADLTENLDWYEGTVVFTNQTEESGDLHLDMELGLLLIRQSGGIRTFPAFKVKQIKFFDRRLQKSRSFISLPFKSSRYNQSANLFEVVLEGELVVLRKQQSTFAIKMEAFMGNKDKYLDPLDDGNYVYYVYDGRRLIKFGQLTKKRMDLVLEKYRLEVYNYARRKNLSFKDTYGRIKAIAYYNAVSQCKKEGGC